MKSWHTASPILVVLLLAAPAAAQTPPAPDPAAQPAPDPTQPPSPGPSTEPTVPPPPAAPPGTGQPPPPPAPAESSKPAPAPSPGQVTSKWSTTLYGFAEFDMMHDSTQTFADSPGNGLVTRPDRFAYKNGRTQTTARNSRLGVRMTAPEWNHIRSSGTLEGDFMGNQPVVSEASFVNNGTFRVRTAYAKLETDYVDVLAGQYYFVFGQGPFFFPMSIWFFSLPNQVFGRTQQLRFSHLWKTDVVNVDLSASVQRPPQRDSEVPDFHGSLKLSVNKIKGPHTSGSGYASIDPLTVAVSGAARHFRVNELAGTPATTHSINGWGITVDAMLPVIPAASAKDKSNAFTLTGSFADGTGFADLVGGISGGAAFPAPPNPMGTIPPPTFTPNIDGGIVQYSATGDLRTLNWRTFMVGAQYYLPPHGEFAIGANYTQGDSNNITKGLSDTALTGVYKRSQFFEALVLGDITPAVRAGAAWQRVRQTYGDNTKATNDRVELSVYFFF